MSDDKRLNEVIRVKKKQSNFVMLDKAFLEDENLSWKAKGILAYLLSKPDNWKVIVGNLVNYSTDGKGSVYKGLSELKEKGYYNKIPIRDEKGIIVRWDSVVFEVPNAENTTSHPLSKNQEVDNQEMDNPFMENREHNNNYYNNNDFNNNQSSLLEKEGRQNKTETNKIQAYTELIKDSIRYTDLEITHKADIKLIDEMVLIMLDVVTVSTETVRIGNEDKPRALVKSVLLKLAYEDIDFVIKRYKDVEETITKKKQYLLTMLYNSKMESTAHLINTLPKQYK